jgi:hypothetical protein
MPSPFPKKPIYWLIAGAALFLALTLAERAYGARAKPCTVTVGVYWHLHPTGGVDAVKLGPPLASGDCPSKLRLRLVPTVRLPPRYVGKLPQICYWPRVERPI